jgi:excisionase family DNA binding protein
MNMVNYGNSILSAFSTGGRNPRVSDLVWPGIVIDEPMESPDTVLLTPKNAVALLAVSEKTLWSLTKDGSIASVRIGRSVRYSKRELLDFIARSSTTSTERGD